MPPGLRRASIALAVSGALSAPLGAHAQIRTDGTLGPAQSLTGPNFAIPASLGQQAGANLFHSFATFGVPTGGSATFSGPASVGNIISRVTGADASSIDGTLRSTIAGANLYLINPKGILFGPNASVDLTGSFYASTANYLRMADGTRFEATAAAPPLLSVAAPAAFGFLGPAAPITAQGSQLIIPEPGGIALVGGPLTIRGGRVWTGGGNLGLVAVASAGEIGTDAAFTPENGLSFASINISSGANIATLTGGVPTPGRLTIRGGQITAADARFQSQNSGAIDAPPVEVTAAGDLSLSNMQVVSIHRASGRSASLLLSGENVLLDRRTRVSVAPTAGAVPPGAYGDIDISARGTLRIVSAPTDPVLTLVQTFTNSAGRGGAIRLSGQSVVLDGARLVSTAQRTGDGGPIEITAGDIALAGGTFVGSLASGGSRGGDIRLVASRSLTMSGLNRSKVGTWIDSSVASGSTGGAISLRADSIDMAGAQIDSHHDHVGKGVAGGDISIDARTIRLRDAGGRLSIIQVGGDEVGTGRSGSLVVRASESIIVEGWGGPPDRPIDDPAFRFGSAINSFSVGPGRTADVIVEAPRIVLQRGGEISTNVMGPGSAGNVIVRGHDIDIRDRGFIHSTVWPGGSGTPGEVRIDATGTLSIGMTPADPPPAGGHAPPAGSTFGVFSLTSGPSSAGGITIDVPTILVGPGGEISSIALPGSGTSGVRAGDIRIRGRDLVLRNATMHSSAALGGTGDGGSIDIDLTGRLQLTGDYSDARNALPFISATALGSGRGGDLRVRADSILIDGGGLAAQTIADGDGGSVDVRARTIDLVNGGGIIASAVQGAAGDGGDVKVVASESLRVSGINGSPAALAAGNPRDVNASATGGGAAAGGAPIPSDIASNTTGTGAGGNVRVEAPRILVSDGARIEAASSGTGPAGSVSVVAAEALEIFGGGAISTEALQSDGGNITILAGNRVHLRDSEITTSVGSGQGAGGNIFIDPTFVILENSRIVANAFGGPGGNVTIIADYFLNSPGSLVEASSALGVPGTVQISTPTLDPNLGLKPLNAQVVDASAFLRESCAARAASGAGSSSLVGVGRGGLAASPGRFAGSSYFGGAPAATPSASTGLKLTPITKARLPIGCANT